MLKTQYIQYLNLPQLPKELVDSIMCNFDKFQASNTAHNTDTYTWSDNFNQELNAWCQQNICADMYFAFQIITGDLPIHKDVGTKTKINYLLSTGGTNVVTEFYSDDQTTLLDSYCIDANKWHIFKADTYHCVRNTEPKQVRLSITSRIF